MTCKDVLAEAPQWVVFNHLTQTYDTPDGTHVAAEVVDSASCMADVFNITAIRDKQRKATKGKP